MDGNAAMTHPEVYPHAQSYNQMKYHDGFRFIDHGGHAERVLLLKKFVFKMPRLLWNLNLPSYIRASNGVRVEPMAHGGINGKGIWLGPNQHLEIDLPVQEFDYSQKDWFLGLYLDDRPLLTDQEQELFMFPDRSRILLAGRKWVGLNFIMMMGNPTPEFKCNEAGGFLAGLKDNSIYSRFSSLYLPRFSTS